MLEGLAGRFVVLWGWRRLVAAALAGAASVLALPPFDLFAILFVSFPVVVWLLDGTIGTGRRPVLRAALDAAAVGWAFGFGYFLAGLYWVGAAFLVEADVFGWLMPLAVVAMPMGLALFPALGLFVARLLWSSGPGRIAAFAFGLAASELLRGHVLTGFPWNLYGYALTASLPLAQSAALVGIYGLTILAVLVFASPAALVGTGSRAWRVSAPVTAVVLLAVMGGYGAVRLAQPAPQPDTGIRLRIVQPAIEQAQKWRPENRSSIFADYLELSDRATSPDAMGVGDVDLLVWPESALPFLFDWEPNALPAIAALLPRGTTLITGMQRMDGQGRAFNSVKVIGADGDIEDIYDKTHLVPFGEYLPLQGALEAIGLEQLTRVQGGFASGADRRPMRAAGAPAFQPLICYEIIFPGAVLGGERPAWMLNVTNDGWFGETTGPWQHLRQARVRAIEEGLPVVRAANTGISAVVDANGRIVASLTLGARGVVDAMLPAEIAPPPYARWRNIPAFVLLLVTLSIAVASRRV